MNVCSIIYIQCTCDFKLPVSNDPLALPGIRYHDTGCHYIPNIHVHIHIQYMYTCVDN